MRTFNANFITEKNKRGTAPVNLMTFGFATPVYLSDRAVTPSGGPAHSGLLKTWGFIDTAVMQTPGSGVLGAIDIQDLEVVVINSTSPRFSANFTTADPPEKITVELYQWFKGLLYSEKELIFKGIVKQVIEYDLYTCRILVRGIFEKYNKKIGEDLLVNTTLYPNADPDDIGTMRNICYGALSNVPCRAVKAGAIDTLRDDLTAAATSFYVSGSSKADFPAGTVTVQIDSEQIRGTYSQATKQFTSVTRGYNSTTAVAHTKGATTAEVLTEYVYEIAAHPVKTIGDILVDGVKQTAGFTAYTGQTGSELTGYEGRAVVKFTALPKVIKQVNLDVSEGNHSHAGATLVFTWFFDTVTVVSGSPVTPGYMCDGSLSSQGRLTLGCEVTLSRTIYQGPGGGTPTRMRVRLKTGGIETGSRIHFWGHGQYLDELNPVDSNVTRSYLEWTDISLSWTDLMAETITFEMFSGANSAYIYEAWLEIEYDAGTAISPADGVALSGNSTAETVIGKQVTVKSLEGYKDDASGTYTGTAYALIQRPGHVFKHLWIIRLGAPSADIDTTTFTAANTFYNTNAYAFALLINTPILAGDLLMRLALQCRSRFLVTAYGKAKLIVRQLAQSSGHAIAKNEIKMDSMKVQRTSIDELINYFNIRYNLDHTKGSNDAQSYLAVKNFSDATSISRYGQKEWKGGENLFYFAAVTSAAMVDHVGAFLLAYHCIIRKMPQFGLFLDNMETEPGDIIDVTHDLDSMAGFTCEVQKMLHRLGSAKNRAIDYLDVIAVEN